MAPVSNGSATGKKQQSLTSFFSPKPLTTASNSVQDLTDFSRVHNPDPEARKRSLVEDDNRQNQATEPPLKRARTAFVGKDVDATLSTRSTISASPAELYRYNGSRSKPNSEEVDLKDDEVPKTRRNELHKKFVKKLGHPDALNWRSRSTTDEGYHAEDEEVEENGEEETQASTKGKKKGAKTAKLTPMELQFLEIKRQHMDTILVVEVGYKFRFFGEDARIAAKELSIVCIPGKMRYDEHPTEAHLDRFASASIPVHRLPVHTKRLVAAGHKVGVVRQIETAALKKVGDNRNTPFVRKLTNLYTKGTYIDETGELEQKAEGTASGGYLLCITESTSRGGGMDEKIEVGVLAVQPATGDIIYDMFEDGFMRSEVETRLLHISPCEFLIVGELSKATEKMIQHLSGTNSNVFGDRSRLERVARSQTVGVESFSHVTKFYAGKVKESSSNQTASALLDKVLKLPEPVTICLSAMISHLKEYGLEHVFDLTKYFQSFSTRTHMVISGTTLESLEVYRNSTDHSEKGSLFWAINKTHTRFGQRLLRKWVGRPLLDKEELEERIEAVQELFDKQSSSPVNELERLLSTTRSDLERSLLRIYYGKCTRPELLNVLQALQKIAGHYAISKQTLDMPFTSWTIRDSIGALPKILDIVVSFLEKINLQAARQDDKYAFFREEFQTEDIQDHQIGIAHVEHELEEHRYIAAEKVKKKKVDYATVAGIEFLIEVPNTEIKYVPASWSKISGTKKVSRFHTPEVIRLIAERDQHREALAAACDKAFKDFLTAISSEYQPLRDAVSALATLDCLLSLSKVASQPGYTKPIFLGPSSQPTIAISQGRHPIAEQTLDGSYIPFSTSLTHPSPLAHLITGPNMGGKSSFVRALALIVLLAQIGSFVPADSLTLTLCDAIYTRTGANDNLFAGESTFMVEVSETARILRSATPRSLIVLDELGRGTSTHDGAAIAQAVLHHVVTETRCLTLFITHYQNLARVADALPGLTNVHMKFKVDKGPDSEEIVTFLYEVGEGIAHRSYGLNVARLAHIPKRVIDNAAEKSQLMEEVLKSRRLKGACRILRDIMENRGNQLHNLVASVDQL